MKKIILSVHILFMLLIGFSSFNNVLAQEKTTSKDIVDDMSVYKEQGIGNFLINTDTAFDYIKRYQKKIRTPFLWIANKKLSQAVWFSKEALELLLKEISDPKLNVDGVRIYLISYDHLNSAEGQEKKHQVSLVMVPTNPNGEKHKDNWEILKNKTEEANKYLKDKGIVAGFNHGQLCPTKCND